MKKLEEFLNKTSYGQWDIQSLESQRELSDNGYIVLSNPDDYNTAGCDYVGEGFEGMDDSMVGSTAYARYARPIIVSIYRKKENYEEERKLKIDYLEKQQEEFEKQQEMKKQELEKGKTKIKVSVNQMKRGYSLNIEFGLKEFEIKQTIIKEIERNLSLTKENICEYIENNYEGITTGYINKIKLSGQTYKIIDTTF